MVLGEGKRQKVIRLSLELLAEALRLPRGTQIKAVCDKRFFMTGEVALLVEHPSFPLVFEGQQIPEVKPLLGEERHVVFMGWSE